MLSLERHSKRSGDRARAEAMRMRLRAAALASIFYCSDRYDLPDETFWFLEELYIAIIPTALSKINITHSHRSLA